MPPPKVVSHEEWVKARKDFLVKEKEFTRLRDELSRERRALPWEKVDKTYLFDGPDGRESLADLFAGRSQLIVYHFMYGPGWEEGCKSCSFLADHFNPAIIHLNQRDVSMVAVSRAPLAKLQSFQKRMGWTFRWLSSLENDFNQDYHVSFSADEMQQGEVYYNYKMTNFSSSEAPGVSVFYRDKNGAVFHTYSCYERGLDMLITAYHYLDLVPKGRDEDHFSYTMEWLRLHDSYDD
ncbi:DUF899 domain-containing protein [Luteithermobacter gelatinilyticus]|uniref:DUF899 domain-containing protein n=1 Tax=Luteithermobacter gelatinilyticus TaxID=2582913 RepID=UPI001106680C|nr:thioredoxin family protein [Luteithermobacter gelatinilyticus]